MTNTIIITCNTCKIIYFSFTIFTIPSNLTNTISCSDYCFIAYIYKENTLSTFIDQQMIYIPSLKHVFGLQIRWSNWHTVPLKSDGHKQIYPWDSVSLLLQVPLFWQGWRISHTALETLQREPMCVESLQDVGKKSFDEGLSKEIKNEIFFW